jgi:hypothetical protein
VHIYTCIPRQGGQGELIGSKVLFFLFFIYTVVCRYLICREISEAEAGCIIRSLLETSYLKRHLKRHPASASEISRQVKLSAHDCISIPLGSEVLFFLFFIYGYISILRQKEGRGELFESKVLFL